MLAGIQHLVLVERQPVGQLQRCGATYDVVKVIGVDVGSSPSAATLTTVRSSRDSPV